eukprot:gb/GECG01002073.1/.p1 GENE.gb/GECG01002073.1/~~gb/GECG01002073.1/.p1  ORF type:complete len:205 (+),score=28.13 gb/GECG01002073.1/:1-615(+)
MASDMQAVSSSSQKSNGGSHNTLAAQLSIPHPNASAEQRPQQSDVQSQGYMRIFDLKPDTLSVALNFIVLEKHPEISRTKDGRTLHTFLVADETASCWLTVFGKDAGGPGDDLKSGNIYDMKGGMTKAYQNCAWLYLGKGGRITRKGEFTKKFREHPNISKRELSSQSDASSPVPNSGTKRSRSDEVGTSAVGSASKFSRSITP